jgi:hypothetical protein
MFTVHIKYEGVKWSVYRNKIKIRKFHNQEEAMAYGRKLAGDVKGEMIVYKQNGEVKRTYSYGLGRNKYNNERVTFRGHEFDSIAERDRYAELIGHEKVGFISDLELQPRFVLQEAFTDITGEKHRAIEYVSDFRYKDKDGKVVVEDVKGMKTLVYRLKKKLFIKRYLGVNVDKFLETSK